MCAGCCKCPLKLALTEPLLRLLWWALGRGLKDIIVGMRPKELAKEANLHACCTEYPGEKHIDASLAVYGWSDYCKALMHRYVCLAVELNAEIQSGFNCWQLPVPLLWCVLLPPPADTWHCSDIGASAWHVSVILVSSALHCEDRTHSCYSFAWVFTEFLHCCCHIHHLSSPEAHAQSIQQHGITEDIFTLVLSAERQQSTSHVSIHQQASTS